MEFSRDNPHIRTLEEFIIQSFLGSYPDKGLFAPLIGEEEFDRLYDNFLHLTDEEKMEVIDKIIKAYFANKAYAVFISKVMPNSSSDRGKTSTKSLTTLHQPRGQQS